ncbi:hypothetical protein ABT56_00385 [Photobacterium aquae]|uniref:Phage virion morphogenesis protein n=1 Tax=Photobacterium aquae TaxID=1195763 RepID=A0A0J1HDE0_9GAMM|nr:hypothetical protein ABT56_00385 [Photobacterium aquae]
MNRQLKDVADKISNLQPLYDQIGEYLLTVHHNRWRLQQSPQGLPWQPLASNYKQRKPVNQQWILVLNDHLRQSLTYWYDEQGLAFGTALEYGAIHHYGGQQDMPPHLAAIPARPWLGVSQDDISEIYDILGDFLMDK